MHSSVGSIWPFCNQEFSTVPANACDPLSAFQGSSCLIGHRRRLGDTIRYIANAHSALHPEPPMPPSRLKLLLSDPQVSASATFAEEAEMMEAYGTLKRGRYDPAVETETRPLHLGASAEARS